MQRLAIIITGFPGSGSTTLGKNIAKRLGWPPPYYSGGVVRWLTAEIEKSGKDAVLKMTTADIVAAMEDGKIVAQPKLTESYKNFPKELDLLVDKVQAKLLEKKEYGVHEGRIAWFLAQRLKYENKALDKIFISICCTVDPIIGARRLSRREEHKDKLWYEIYDDTQRRIQLERQRYQELYHIENHLDPKNFDIVIDTSRFDEEGAYKFALYKTELICPVINKLKK